MEGRKHKRQLIKAVLPLEEGVIKACIYIR